jgi:predicted acylesterase/phospholipase RssA
MKKVSKKKRRGFVMTGGGAKGLYEAGVIHAFHLLGMEFDVITGSSIGAMNSIFYAEYLFCKRQLHNDILQDPLLAIEHMDCPSMRKHRKPARSTAV